jgi:hypothetical protein
MKTRKKFSIRITGIFLLLILMLAGCQDPVSDYTVSDGTSIPGPAGLKAEKLTGGVLLSWQTVPDAKGYQVYRYNHTTGEEKDLSNGTYSGLYALDLVSWSNPLAEGTYTYKVIAISALGGNDRSVVGGTVFNGVSTIDVTFAPANASATPPTTIDDIPARTDSSWITLAALPDAEDGRGDYKRLVIPVKPNLSYQVKVALGGAFEGTDAFKYLDNYSFEISPDYATPFVGEKYINLPEIGGTTTVEITAQYAGGSYYTGTAVQRKAVVQEVGLPQPSFYSIERNDKEPQYVEFQWGNVTGATGYKIYKAEYEGTGYGEYNTIKSAWAPVTFSVAPIQSNSGWQAVENDAAGVGKKYAYILVAEAGTRKSLPSVYTLLDAARPSISNFRSSVVDASTLQIQLTWDAEPSTTYTLAKASAGILNGLDEDNDTDLISAATFTDIALTTADYLQGKGVKIDSTGLTARTSYIYRLIATKNGVASLPRYTIVNEGPFSNKSYLSVSPYSGGKLYNLEIHLQDNGTYWGDSPVIKVYRKVADQPETAYVYLNRDITAANITSPADEELDPGEQYYYGVGHYVFADTAVTVGTSYTYKFVVTKGTTEFDNYQYGGYLIPASTNATMDPANVSYITTDTNHSATAVNFVLYFNGTRLNGAPVTVVYRSRAAGAADWGEWTTRTGTISHDSAADNYRYVVPGAYNTDYQIATIAASETAGNWEVYGYGSYYGKGSAIPIYIAPQTP